MQLSVTLLLMFVGALGSGALPYFLSISETQLDVVGALGGGLLIGTALAVIVVRAGAGVLRPCAVESPCTLAPASSALRLLNPPQIAAGGLSCLCCCGRWGA